MTRPRLRPGVHLLRRGPDTVQLGRSVDDGVVLSGLDRREVVLLRSLDGARTRTQLVRYWQEHGVPAVRGREILRLLEESRLLVDDERGGHSRRADGCVLVTGVGELAATVVALLRSAGVGRVHGGRDAAVDSRPDDDPQAVVPDLEIVLGCAHPGQPQGWGRSGCPAVLPVGTPPGSGVTVGPLVRPEVGPCLDCLTHCRSELDPAYASVAAQLVELAGDATRGPAAGDDPEHGAPVALTHAAAGLVTMTALAWLDGDPPPPGVSYELRPPWPQVRRRRWPTHPRCECGRDARQRLRAVTMVG